MKITLRQIRTIIFGIIFLLLAGSGGYYLGKNNISFSSLKSSPRSFTENKNSQINKDNVDLTLFWQVWDRLESDYLKRKDIDRQKMVYGAISGMVSSLGDPYTVFLPPTENKETKDDLRGDFEGVGIQIGYNKDQRLSVISPMSGTPAEKAGIKPGDLIVKIVDKKQNIDKDTNGISLPEAVRLIRGPRGSSVDLTIIRDLTKDPFVVSLKRETIVVKSVELKIEEKKNKTIAVIKLSRFGERTYQEWQEAVDSIKKQELSNKNFGGIILDLRNNPGGFLQGSVFIGSEFSSVGPVVLQDKGANGKEPFEVNRKGQLLDEPLVVLVNGGSASASEIVAGFLQEMKRAKIVGEKSFGKGTIQEAEDLPGGAGLHITIARWLLPSGKSIDKEGIMPDFEVKMDEKDQTKDPQMDKAVEVLLKQ